MKALLRNSIGMISAIAFFGTNSASANTMISLSGSWQLANMTAGNSPMPMLPAGDIPLSAEFSDGQIFGSGGCNRFIGGYEAKSGTVKISTLASTFMACEEPIMSQETRFLTALQGAERYEVDQGQLTIFYKTEQGEGVLRFVSQGSQPVPAMW
ncbi:hypothetical protein LEP3755_14250 [Leptolyngbya sp. NIES-3755]|nr:hypothetical protein LEP3755_14250 [Leptolyngbya sp. NIES-3755]